MDLQLAGKRALVTGSTSGIGVGIAKTLAGEGAAVVINGRDAERAESVAAELRASGAKAAIALGDLSTDEGAESVARAAEQAFGGIDILVNNAGGRSSGGGAALWDSGTPNDWIETYQKNTVAALRLIRLLVEPMKARGWGRIIQIVSASAMTPPDAIPHYAASKAAMVNMTLSLSKALKFTGVTSNAVAPGMITTPALERWMDGVAVDKGFPGDRARAEAYIVENLVHQTVKRIGTPEDIGTLVAYLASPLSEFVNGANFRIDGGGSPAIN